METNHGRDPEVDNKLSEPSSVDNRLSEPLEVDNNLSEPVLVTDIESRKPQHMAFTIHFEDTNKNNITTKSIQERLSNFALKHRRNQSLPTTEEKKTTKGEVNSALAVNSSQRTANSFPLVVNSSPPNINSPLLAVNSSALPINKTVARRAGYHSEGYFSSDQEEDIRNRSGFFVRKLKNLEKGLRTTNLAQEKINMADQTSQTKLNNSPHMSRHEFGDFHAEGPITLRTRLDELKRQNSNPTNNAVTFNPLDDEELSKDEWLMASTIDDTVETPAIDNGNVIDDGDVENELSNDTASEAGTYTIERDLACPEEDQARKEIDQVVAEKEDPEVEDFKMSSYRNGTNWINDWATQVAKHNHHQEPEPLVSGLPPLPVDKHKAPSMTTRIPSPIHSPSIALPPTGRRSNAPPSPTRTHHRSPVHLPPAEGADRHSDSSLETESYLRATESVVTAMQARMSLSLDSGGESDGDTSHGFKPVERGRSAVDRHQLQRRSSGVSEGSPRHLRTGHSDSSSEASEVKTKKEEPPLTLSLRRARLDCDPVPTPVIDNRKKKTESVSVTAYNQPKKTVEPPRPNIPLHTRAIKASSPKPEPTKTFSRTDCGRFSVRAPKAVSQSQAPYAAKPNPVVKKDAKKDSKKSGGRSNSTLSSREVEFQNWKRRKSYDPMKAAAEGKKKDAAKKATFNNSMTQSYTTAEETSPSHQSSVLRSASFHGTLGMAPKYTSSEDEVTLSAEEEEEEEEDEDSPTTEYPVPLPPVLGSPSKSLLDGAIGGSRVSLHSSTASNSSLKGRTKPEALDSLVMAALGGLSNKLRGRSCILLKKLRILYEEDPEKSQQLSAIIDVLEGPANPGSPQGKSASKELSDTLKNLKRLESFVSVLDEVLFDDEDFDDLDADKLQ